MWSAFARIPEMRMIFRQQQLFLLTKIETRRKLLVMSREDSPLSTYHRIAFAPWGDSFRPLVVLNPDTDVPSTIREQWAAFPSDFELCCWINGDITFIPRRKIIDYAQAVAEGYCEKPLERSAGPLLDSGDYATQTALQTMEYLLSAEPKQRAQAVMQGCSFAC